MEIALSLESDLCLALTRITAMKIFYPCYMAQSVVLSNYIYLCSQEAISYCCLCCLRSKWIRKAALQHLHSTVLVHERTSFWECYD